jgi:hypothetical protein
LKESGRKTGNQKVERWVRNIKEAAEKGGWDFAIKRRKGGWGK